MHVPIPSGIVIHPLCKEVPVKGAQVQLHHIKKRLVGLIAALALSMGGVLAFATSASAAEVPIPTSPFIDLAGTINITIENGNKVHYHIVYELANGATEAALRPTVDESASLDLVEVTEAGVYDRTFPIDTSSSHAYAIGISIANNTGFAGPYGSVSYEAPAPEENPGDAGDPGTDDEGTDSGTDNGATEPVLSELTGPEAHSAGENLIVVSFDYSQATDVESSKAVIYFDGQVADQVDTTTGDGSYSKALTADSGDVRVQVVTETQAEAGSDVVTKSFYDQVITVPATTDDGSAPPSDGPVVIEDQPAAPTATDDYGIDNDVVNVPANTDTYTYKVDDQRVNGVGLVRVTVAPAEGYVFGGKVQTTWEFTFTNEARPGDGASHESPKPTPSTQPTEPSKPSTKPAVPVLSNDNDTPAPVVQQRNDGHTSSGANQLPSAHTDGADLAKSGFDATGLWVAAGLILAAGVVLVPVARRRRAHR